MKRRITGITLLAAVMVLSAPTAFGFGKKSSNCGSPCGATYGAAYGGGCSPCGGGYTVSYVDQKVTAYKTEWETKDVKVMVNEWVSAKENFKYLENVPETKKEKVKVKEAKQGTEKFKYMAQEWATAKEKVKVPEQKATTKDVEFVTYELQPVVTQQTRTVCEWVCVPVTVTCVVAPPPCGNSGRGGLFGGLCGKKHNNCDPCNSCAPPPCPQVVTRTVMQRQMVTRQITVPCTTYNRIEKKGTHKVTSYETIWVEKEVEVRKLVSVEKEGTRPIVTWVEVEKEVSTTSWKQVEKTGSREVRKLAQVEKTVKQNFAKQVAYETTVKVPVYTPAPAPAPCYSPCASYAPVGMSGGCCGGGYSGGGRGGLFGGRGHGGCCR